MRNAIFLRSIANVEAFSISVTCNCYMELFIVDVKGTIESYIHCIVSSSS
jgi:hypothetical protein